MSVRELFRRRLGKESVSPRASLQDDLMKHLARREFMHFIPSRFNIYYLGAVAAAGITAGLLIFSSPRTDRQKTDNNKAVSSDTVEINVFDIQATLPIVVREDNVTGKRITDVEKAGKERSALSHTGTKEARDTGLVIEAAVTGVVDSMKSKGLFVPSRPGGMKLQDSYMNGTALFELSVTKGCAPLRIHFTNNAGSVDSCRWTFGDGGYSDEINPDWIYDVDGEYRVTLKVFNSDGYHASSSARVTVFPKPEARFEISPQEAVIPDDRIRFMNYSSGAVHYRWDFGDGDTSILFEPVHKYKDYNNYDVSLVAYSEWGCADSLTVHNAFSDSKYFIEFPNAFIPNTGGSSGGLYSSKSDEVAQVFHPVYSGVTEYQLKIFSKLGVLIFESNDINTGWDGYYKGQLCNAGVYIWKVRGSFINGEPFVSMGDVTLLRSP